MNSDKLERVVRLLEELEWSGIVLFDEWYNKGPCCPVCKGEQDEGHTGTCRLAAELYED